MDVRLSRLRQKLEQAEWELLMRKTGSDDSLPFDAPDRIDALLAAADEDTIELFAKCESILEETPAEASEQTESDALIFVFDYDSVELGHFLGSLRRNGFRTSTVEGAQTSVHVWLDASTDHEFFQMKETVRSLYEVSRIARGRNPKGHRLQSP